MLVGTSWEASWGPLGGNFEASRGLFWSLLGPPVGLLGAFWGGKLGFSIRGAPLGPLLGPSSGPLGPFRAPLGPSWGPLGQSWGPPGSLSGRLGAVLGASWPLFERQTSEKRERQKPSNTWGKSMVFALRDSLGQPPAGFVAHLGVVSGAPWLLSGLSSGHLKSLGPSGRHIRPSRRPPRPA